MVLLMVAGLFTQSLLNVARVDLGMDTASVATFSIAPVLNGYPPERSAELFRRIEEGLAALPGVASVGSVMVGVVAGDSWGNNVSVQGFEVTPDMDTNARYNAVSGGYFRTLAIPLLSGRDFTAQDTVGRPKSRSSTKGSRRSSVSAPMRSASGWRSVPAATSTSRSSA